MKSREVEEKVTLKSVGDLTETEEVTQRAKESSFSVGINENSADFLRRDMSVAIMTSSMVLTLPHITFFSFRRDLRGE